MHARNAKCRPGELTLKNEGEPSKRVDDQSQSLVRILQVTKGEAVLVLAFGILGKQVFKLLWDEAPLVVICAAVAAVFGLVDVGNVNAKQRIGKEGRLCRIRESSVDDQHGQDREKDAESQSVESAEGIQRRDDPIAVL